ncbi:MAG TPA: hypothetical protein VD833_11955 [Vicinamibacterales bacterium]|nr:hypothetical protein [Vicinamibacterales bacterium]
MATGENSFRPRRREFDGRRQSAEPRADLGDGANVLVAETRQGRAHRSRAVQEQCRCRKPLEIGSDIEECSAQDACVREGVLEEARRRPRASGAVALEFLGRFPFGELLISRACERRAAG